MSKNADIFLKKTLGEEFLSSLKKFDLWKPGTKTVLDHEEIKTALQIVPRALMSLIIAELTPMALEETKEINLPMANEARMTITKHERDVFSGEVFEDNKKIVEFKFRSIPGVALVIMSAFEMYSVEDLDHHEPVAPDIEAIVNKLINERMELSQLVSRVVDKKMVEKDAIEALLMSKLTSNLMTPLVQEHKAIAQIVVPINVPSPIIHDQAAPPVKESPIKKFVQKRVKPPEFHFEMVKGEVVDCPDCKQNIFKNNVFSGCICLGEDREHKVYIKKTENGFKIRFGKKWDLENIEMLVDMLRNRNGR